MKKCSKNEHLNTAKNTILNELMKNEPIRQNNELESG